MADTFIQLPDDTANTGKKVRVNSRTVSAVTVHEYHFIVQDKTNDDAARVLTTAPTTEAGLVVRNIPSGTQAVSNGGTFAVQAAQSGTWNVTNISGTISLPTGAATAAKQPALGTAGTSSADVISIQGIASMTPVKVDGSGVTQPVSGTFWQATQPVSGTITANAGTNLNTSALALDATLTGGTAKAINRGGAKGATTAADVTSTAQGADHQSLDVQLYHGGATVNPTSIRALTSADVVTVAASTNRLGSVRLVDSADADLTAAKGSQSSRAVGTQALKDSGRTYVTLRASLITGVTTEALATFTKNVNGTDTTGQTAYTITNGKTFRIQALQVIINNTTTVANNIIVNVRVAATVSASSPVVATCAAAAAAAVATVKGMDNLAVPDGIDIAGNGSIQIGISHLENVTTASIASFTLIGYEY